MLGACLEYITSNIFDNCIIYLKKISEDLQVSNVLKYYFIIFTFVVVALDFDSCQTCSIYSIYIYIYVNIELYEYILFFPLSYQPPSSQLVH